MEIISNSIQPTNKYTQTKQKDLTSNDKNFNQYMNNENQKDLKTKNEASEKKDYVEVSNTNQTVTYSKDALQSKANSYDPKREFLNFLDEHLPDFFEKNNIPKEDEETIRKVLDDNLITEEEAKELSFDQAQTLHKIQFNRFDYKLEDSDNLLIIPYENNFVHSILGVTVSTENDTFNKAIHKTLVENYSATTAIDALAELSYTLKQAYTGMDIGFNFHQSPVPFGLLEEFENSKIEMDYEEHLLKMLEHADIMLTRVKDPNTREHLGDINKMFGLILNNYKELKTNENN